MKKFFSLLVMLVAVGGFSLGCEGDATDTGATDTPAASDTDTDADADADADATPAEGDDAGSSE